MTGSHWAVVRQTTNCPKSILHFLDFQPILYFFYFFQALENLRKISDGSLDGIEFPNSDPLNKIQVDIKKEDLTDYEVPITSADYSDIDIKSEVLEVNKAGKKRVRNKKSNKFPCLLCGKKYMHQKHLNFHVRSVHEEKKDDALKEENKNTFENKGLWRKDSNERYGNLGCQVAIGGMQKYF